ncbi:putative PurR-regulated permease PerM [Novosphingobium kunmingense]|uniref:Putative PurR-regulated permease PerM n=1 Tax=Novosphingobium kunmingense TaxID=1211806 RepID=A0A2N0H747_9SPHN|nr:AI-2E family transporter [Novosphingobium kunmingense]PKB14761.1 putative PurR-regulated permease PerM [Novosphingobium kunmingense]
MDKQSETPPEPVHDRAEQQVRMLSAIMLLLAVGVLLALPFVLMIGSVVFLPLTAALILSILVSPLADQLSRLSLPNALASFLALVLALGLFGVLLSAIMQPMVETFDQLPSMTQKVTQRLSQLRGNLGWLNDISATLDRLGGHNKAREVVLAGPNVVEQFVFATPAVVIEVLVTVLMSFFMIESRVRMRERLLHDRIHGYAGLKAARVLREVQDLVASYMATVGLINLGVGAIVTLGAAALGLDAPLMWGALAAMLNFLPYLGPLVMMVLLALFGLGNADTVFEGLVPALLYLGLHAVEANLVTPAVLGRRFTLNPVMILAAISFFYWIWGVTGALLAMPMLLVLTALFHHVGQPNLIGFIFGEPLFPESEPEEI